MKLFLIIALLSSTCAAHAADAYYLAEPETYFDDTDCSEPKNLSDTEWKVAIHSKYWPRCEVYDLKHMGVLPGYPDNNPKFNFIGYVHHFIGLAFANDEARLFVVLQPREDEERKAAI